MNQVLPTLALLATSFTQNSQTEQNIKNLGHDDFFIRERATQFLLGELNESTIFRMQLAALSPDPEVRMRVEYVVDNYFDGVKPTNYPVMPWLDMIWKPTDHMIVTKMKVLFGVEKTDPITKLFDDCLEITGKSADKDSESYRVATSVFVKKLLKAGIPKEKVVNLLDEMVEQEVRYREMMRMPALRRLERLCYPQEVK